MRPSERTMAVLALLWAVAASAVVARPELRAWRAPVVLPFVLVVPGWAWVRLARLGSWFVEAAASVLVSLALLALGTAAALLAGRWSPTFGFGFVTAAMLVALALGLRRPSRDRP